MEIKQIRKNKINLATVSGIVSTSKEMLIWVHKNLKIDFITTKSIELLPNEGYREPVFTEISPGNYGNAVGLKNPGLKIFKRELENLCREYPEIREKLIISISASKIEDLKALIESLEDYTNIFELNFSCPHAKSGYGASIGSDRKIAFEYVRELRNFTKKLLIPKLTPNVEKIEDIALSCIEGGADGISAINTSGPYIYLERNTNLPILSNKRGGRSGEQIKSIALSAISKIRKKIGREPLIIGMGGVKSKEDVEQLKNAGADIIGIGSSFALLPQEKWSFYIEGLKSKGESERNCFIKKRQMSFKAFKVLKNEKLDKDIFYLTLKGKMRFRAGELVFIWHPKIGEKPFSLAKSSPITFLIKVKGQFTKALSKIKKGEKIYIRGAYGRETLITESSQVIIFAGGTGHAVSLSLAKRFKERGKNVKVIYSTSSENQNILRDDLKRYSTFEGIKDEGERGRAIKVLKERYKTTQNIALYTIGPEKFMLEIADYWHKNISEEVYLSFEKTMLCGIGVCGLCSCKGILTCQNGTFFKYKDYLNL